MEIKESYLVFGHALQSPNELAAGALTLVLLVLPETEGDSFETKSQVFEVWGIDLANDLHHLVEDEGCEGHFAQPLEIQFEHPGQRPDECLLIFLSPNLTIRGILNPAWGINRITCVMRAVKRGLTCGISASCSKTQSSPSRVSSRNWSYSSNMSCRSQEKAYLLESCDEAFVGVSNHKGQIVEILFALAWTGQYPVEQAVHHPSIRLHAFGGLWVKSRSLLCLEGMSWSPRPA